jgi:hypothetical protein
MRMKPVVTASMLIISAARVLVSQGIPPARAAVCERRVMTQAAARQTAAGDSVLDVTTPGGGRLRYLGVRHSFDSTDAEFAAMVRVWNALRPTVAFYEGTGTDIAATPGAAIARSGEPGLIRYLAARDHIPARSLEPTRVAEVDELLGRFSAEQLMLFYVTRPLSELRERKHFSRAALDSTLPLLLTAMHGVPTLESVLPDTAAFRAAFARWFPGMAPIDAPSGWFDPLHSSTETGSRFMNDVNAASSAFRDVYMYRSLVAAWNPGARIFAEVGRDHLPAQAAALRCAVGP